MIDLFTLDLNQIVQLATQVAGGIAHGAKATGDDLFEYTIGIAILIYEMDP